MASAGRVACGAIDTVTAVLAPAATVTVGSENVTVAGRSAKAVNVYDGVLFEVASAGRWESAYVRV